MATGLGTTVWMGVDKAAQEAENKSKYILVASFIRKGKEKLRLRGQALAAQKTVVQIPPESQPGTSRQRPTLLEKINQDIRAQTIPKPIPIEPKNKLFLLLIGRIINSEVCVGAALLALKTFTRQSFNISVKMFLDNNTAVCYINKCGGTKSRNLTEVAKQISEWCEEKSISLSASFLPGKLNVIADRESRAKTESSDWKLCERIFQKISLIWPTDIDLFSSCWNNQLDNFISWKPQPLAFTFDTFFISWKPWRGYAFPPFSIIPRCLEKLRREQSTIILVWLTQPWFPILFEL
ncbi:Uncharacterized protein APZ42_033037 [Daphnia magna]|uniref:Uncharacterized protein n=1 Tax=Daphnia magna TaxID=35525 RepID=A0A162D265_9CRUS|nr:Uncharacterized protein APZ42_033037 [Daphnia magna]